MINFCILNQPRRLVIIVYHSFLTLKNIHVKNSNCCKFYHSGHIGIQKLLVDAWTCLKSMFEWVGMLRTNVSFCMSDCQLILDQTDWKKQGKNYPYKFNVSKVAFTIKFNLQFLIANINSFANNLNRFCKVITLAD